MYNNYTMHAITLKYIKDKVGHTKYREVKEIIFTYIISTHNLKQLLNLLFFLINFTGNCLLTALSMLFLF